MDANLFLAKADENFLVAQYSSENNFLNASTSRAYYAMFQAAVAILIKKGFPPRQKYIDHGWVQSNFVNELIRRRKIFPGKFKSYLPDAQILRNMADYESKLISKKTAKQQLKKSEEFINRIKLEFQNAQL